MATRLSWLQPLLGWVEFHELLPPPCLSLCPTCAEPALLLVQLLQVWSAAVGVGAAVGRRTGQDVVLVRLVADAVDQLALLGERELFAERVADARLLDGVAVQHAGVGRDDLAAEVVPRSVADAVARAHGARALRAEVGAPHGVAALSRGLGERLAVRVRAGEPAEIRAVALAHAGHKERHRLLLLGRGRTRRLLGEHVGSRHSGHDQCRKH